MSQPCESESLLVDVERKQSVSTKSSPPPYCFRYPSPLLEWEDVKKPYLFDLYKYKACLINLLMFPPKRSNNTAKGFTTMTLLMERHRAQYLQRALDETFKFQTILNSYCDPPAEGAEVFIGFYGGENMRIYHQYPNPNDWKTLESSYSEINNGILWKTLRSHYVFVHLTDRIPNRRTALLEMVSILLKDMTKVNDPKSKSKGSLYYLPHLSSLRKELEWSCLARLHTRPPQLPHPPVQKTIAIPAAAGPVAAASVPTPTPTTRPVATTATTTTTTTSDVTPLPLLVPLPSQPHQEEEQQPQQQPIVLLKSKFTRARYD
jgi:hypothetical protein